MCTKWAVNDAALVPFAGECELCRIVAITDDGRGVVRWQGSYRVEPAADRWRYCGTFVWRFPRWRFAPISNEKSGLPDPPARDVARVGLGFWLVIFVACCALWVGWQTGYIGGIFAPDAPWRAK